MKYLRKLHDFLQTRFDVVILWGLRDNIWDTPHAGDGEICAQTARQIEKWFRAGVRHHEDDVDAGEHTECPHAEGSTARHWHTRGYAHSARMFRALKAEIERDKARASAERVERELIERGIWSRN